MGAARATRGARLNIRPSSVRRACVPAMSSGPVGEPARRVPLHIKVVISILAVWVLIGFAAGFTGHLMQLQQAMLRSVTSQAFLSALLAFTSSVISGVAVWMINSDTAAAARDAAAAEQRKIDAAAAATRDEAAAEQRKIDVAEMKARDAALLAVALRTESRVAEFMTIATHQARSLAAGLVSLRTDPTSASSPAFAWSAAEVSAWFARSEWRQYERHFAEYDGRALFTLTQESQLAARGVLPAHTAPLLAALLALL